MGLRLLLPALVALTLALATTAAPAPNAAAKPRCHFVTKKVNGHKKRVCAKPKPKPKPVSHFLKRVDVGGYKLAIECAGKGSPTIVLDSGFGTGRGAWWKVLPPASRTTRVCSYDRAGLGQSDSRPGAAAPDDGHHR